jgi:transcriptional regulator with GAF, ATPase, and Fis domain
MPTDTLEVADLHQILGRNSVSTPVRTAPQAAANSTREDAPSDGTTSDAESMSDRERIEKALEKTAGNVSKAAAILSISRETLHTRIKKHGIDIARYRSV